MKGISIVTSVLLLADGGGVTQWLKNQMLSCTFKSYTGVDCPGCGFQRSVLSLVRGDFTESFKLYPPTIPLIILAAFLLLHLKLDFKLGALTIKLMYILVVTMVVINYIYKVYYHQLF